MMEVVVDRCVRTLQTLHGGDGVVDVVEVAKCETRPSIPFGRVLFQTTLDRTRVLDSFPPNRPVATSDASHAALIQKFIWNFNFFFLIKKLFSLRNSRFLALV